MTTEDVVSVQNLLRVAIHTLKTAYAQKMKQHQEQMNAYRPDGGVGGSAQLAQQQQQGQQQQGQQQAQHPHQLNPHQQQQQALAAMQFLGPHGGLGAQQSHAQQRPPSQPQYDSPKLDPSKAQPNLGQPQKAAPQAQVKQQRKPVGPGSQPVNTPSPAAAQTPSNMESAATPSSMNEPVTPKSPRSKAKVVPKRTPSQVPKKKGPMKLEMPPPLTFDQQTSNKRQREDDAPPAESMMPVAGPSTPKRVKTEIPESVAPIKTEYHNDNAIESMDEAIAQLQNGAVGQGGEVIDPDILAQLSEFLDGATAGVAGPSGPSQQRLLDEQIDSAPKVEDVFDFSYYLNDTVGDDDPLGGAGVDVLEADTPDLNTNKETPDSATDDIEHPGQKSPGKGELPVGDGKNLTGSRAPTLTEGFWEAFNDGEMPEGAYFMGGGANGFNWSGPIDSNASWIGITGTAA